MNKKDMIIKGYKGVMDLDLSLVPENVREIAIKQHLEDIKEYTKYQSQLKPHLRYENTIERVQQMWDLDKFHLDKRRKIAKDKERKIDQEILARRNKE